jgi:hypothetical protein
VPDSASSDGLEFWVTVEASASSCERHDVVDGRCSGAAALDAQTARPLVSLENAESDALPVGAVALLGASAALSAVASRAGSAAAASGRDESGAVGALAHVHPAW